MLKLSRRQFLLSTSALLLSRVQPVLRHGSRAKIVTLAFISICIPGWKTPRLDGT